MANDISAADQGLTRNVLRLLRTSFSSVPGPAMLLLAIVGISSFRAGLYVASMGGVTQALIDDDQDAAVRWTLLFALAAYGEYLSYPFRAYLESIVLDRTVHRIQHRVLDRASSLPLVAFEHGSFFARLERASDDLGVHVSAILNNLMFSGSLVIMGASVLVPLWFISPWFVPILLAGIVPGFVAQYRTARVVHAARVRNATGDRLLRHLGAILTDRNAGAEIRLFGNGADLVRRWVDARMARSNDLIAAEATRSRAMTVGEVGVGLGVVVTLAIMVRLMIDGAAPVGSWVTVTIGIDWYLGMLYGLASTTRGFREESDFLGDLFTFEAESDAITAQQRGRLRDTPAGDGAKPVNNPAVLEDAMSITAEHVSFGYPGLERTAVRDVSLHVRPGERIAIVGENGAGKSTLIRLLTGLYLPDSGTVRMDGLDSASEAALALRSEIGAVFQDYVPWQLSVRENIGFGDTSRVHDNTALLHAADKAGIADLIEDLPGGLDDFLGRQFGERDLSGGQWQRVALARAFFRDSRLLVLDEPTAALDPLAEQRLFERFASLTEGRTAIMISHRLGPARYADRVIVMDGGRIVEVGHHDALLAKGGLYARMFAAQSEWYNSP